MFNMSSKQVQLLTNRVSSSSRLQPGSLINYANDLDIAADGTIYFTDSVNISPHRCVSLVCACVLWGEPFQQCTWFGTLSRQSHMPAAFTARTSSGLTACRLSQH
jgi:hypothetical protein